MWVRQSTRSATGIPLASRLTIRQSRFGKLSLACSGVAIICLLLQLVRNEDLTVLAMWTYFIICPIGFALGVIGVFRRLRGIGLAVAGVVLNTFLLIFEVSVFMDMSGMC